MSSCGPLATAVRPVRKQMLSIHELTRRRDFQILGRAPVRILDDHAHSGDVREAWARDKPRALHVVHDLAIAEADIPT